MTVRSTEFVGRSYFAPTCGHMKRNKGTESPNSKFSLISHSVDIRTWIAIVFFVYLDCHVPVLFLLILVLITLKTQVSNNTVNFPLLGLGKEAFSNLHNKQKRKQEFPFLFILKVLYLVIFADGKFHRHTAWK